MADLLLELFSEEIPARMQADALSHLQTALGNKLKETGIAAEAGQGFVTPRRLAVWIKNLPVEQAATETELKGPKVGAPEAALQGFLKKSGLTQADVTERDGVYFAVVKKEGKQTADALKTIIEGVLASFPWPKSMRWGTGETTWVRPLHSILCIFNGAVIPVSFAGVTAGHTTCGHRFMAPQKIMITNPADYESALHSAKVEADRDVRQQKILEQAKAAADAAGLVLKQEQNLLDEVTGLVEYPVVLTGTIDAKFMDLPKEVLVSEMRAHQKYFALENVDGSLSDKFLITSNMKSTDEGKAIIAGNERVLRARLSDGRFFWDQDRKKPLSEWAEGLKTVTFHAKLGTIADKVSRIEALATQLAEHVKGADKKLVAQTAKLCKADLTTGMVGEFPELQGVMGRYYAVAQKEEPSVADAIRDHYKPQGPGDSVPSNPVSICVALADKLDTLVSMFAIGEKPTGSKDPFALRRSALGIIRIILDNNLRIPLHPILIGSFLHTLMNKFELQKEKFVSRLTEAEDLLPNSSMIEIFVKNTTAVKALEKLSKEKSESLIIIALQVKQFLIDRLKVQLKDLGLRHDVVNAVVSNGDDDLVRVVERAKALQAFIGTPDGANLLAAYKRASNMLAIEEKKDNKKYNQSVNAETLTLPEEKTLNQALAHTQLGVISLLEQEQYAKVMAAFSTLRAPVDSFFDKVLVNDSDNNVRETRLNLLSQLRDTLDSVANFALIEGETKEQKKAA